MLNISFLACTKVELWDLTVCIAVNGEKFQGRAMTLVQQYPTSNLSDLSEIFSYTTMYLSYRAKIHTHTHTDSDVYSIVGFCKNTKKFNIQYDAMHLSQPD